MMPELTLGGSLSQPKSTTDFAQKAVGRFPDGFAFRFLHQP